MDDPYEPPLKPEVVIESDEETVEESLARIIVKLEDLGYIRGSTEEPVYFVPAPLENNS